MKTKNQTANPALPTAKARKKMEDRDKQKQMLDDFLLKRVIEEAKLFRKPDMRERRDRQDGEE